MRLIDADRLRNIAISNRDVEMVYEIDHSPTVERPHGEWVYHADWESDGECAYECSRCGMGSDVDYDFCPNCGASMRKEGDENG
jgi:hypothetical protein